MTIQHHSDREGAMYSPPVLMLMHRLSDVVGSTRQASLISVSVPAVSARSPLLSQLLDPYQFKDSICVQQATLKLQQAALQTSKQRWTDMIRTVTSSYRSQCSGLELGHHHMHHQMEASNKTICAKKPRKCLTNSSESSGGGGGLSSHIVHRALINAQSLFERCSLVQSCKIFRARST